MVSSLVLQHATADASNTTKFLFFLRWALVSTHETSILLSLCISPTYKGASPWLGFAQVLTRHSPHPGAQVHHWDDHSENSCSLRGTQHTRGKYCPECCPGFLIPVNDPWESWKRRVQVRVPQTCPAGWPEIYRFWSLPCITGWHSLTLQVVGHRGWPKC